MLHAAWMHKKLMTWSCWVYLGLGFVTIVLDVVQKVECYRQFVQHCAVCGMVQGASLW